MPSEKQQGSLWKSSVCVAADPHISSFEKNTFLWKKLKLKLEGSLASFIIPEIVTDSKKNSKHSVMFFLLGFGSVTLLLKLSVC